ncbi:MAG: SBBP repeat-containing protein [Bacteroidia bacterium]|nr:SBBP repeat-containing protein [Bacteroidia bacterium]
MKKITLFFSVIIFSLNVFSQAPNWSWARSAGGDNDDIAHRVAADAQGNVYMTGYFNSPYITFDTTNLNNVDGFSNDIFIAKYDSSGNMLWARAAGGGYGDFGYGVATDASGNVYVTGCFDSPTITFGTITLNNSGSNDIFVVKYDSSGNVLWARSASGNNDDVGYAITTDANANVYVTGYFASPTLTFGTTTLTNADFHDFFLAKYDSSGNVLWARSASGSNYDEGYGVAVDASGNVYVTGNFFTASVTFGTTTLNSSGNLDIFIAKYDSSGNVLWAQRAGGSDGDNSTGIVTDGNGNAYLTGWFASTSITFGTTTMNNAGIYDMFIAKYDSSGNVLWAKSAGGNNWDKGLGISADASGNTFVTGFFVSTSITFGTTTLSNPFLYTKIFIVKYNSNGIVLWVKAAGGSGGQVWGSDVVADVNGNIYITGAFNNSSIVFGTTTLYNDGDPFNDVFLAKLAYNTTGINETETFTSGILVFPNPAGNELRIKNPELRIESIVVWDMFCKIAISYQPSANSQKPIILDVSKLNPGIYFVKVRGEKGERVAKFVKE